MLGLIPLVLLGGVMALNWHNPKAAQTPYPMVAEQGLGGYLQAIHAELAQQLPQANQGYLAALANDPDNMTLRQRSLTYALATNDFENATRLAKSLPLAEQPPIAQLALLVEAVRENKLNDARTHMQNLQRMAPTLPLVQVLESQLAAANGTAVEKLIPLLELNGWVGQWHAARLALQAGQPEAANTLLRKALKTNPGAYPVAQLALRTFPAAEQAAVRAAFTEANTSLAPALSQTPTAIVYGTPAQALRGNLAAALQGFALELWAAQAMEPALQLSVMAQQIGPDAQLASFLPYAHALLLEATGDTAGAEAVYKTLLRTPDFAALAALRLNDIGFQNATTTAEQRRLANAAWRLAKASPSSPLFWQHAAQLALASGQFVRAAEATSAMFPLLPKNPSSTLPLREAELYFARGAALAQAGETLKAEADLQAAIARNPAHAEALNYLGFMWVDENRNLDAAYAMLKKAHLLAPNSAAITDSVGWAYYRKGDYAVARDYLEKALELDPELPEILSHLADTYAKLNQPTEAAKLWRRALALADAGAEVPSPAFLKELRAKVRALP